MIRSMTAFANAEAEINNLILSCELRAVNHRYCDITIKLPEWLRFAEADIRSAMLPELKRGRIECSVVCKRQSESAQAFNVNMSVVETIVAATGKIEALMQEPASFSALDVLSFPGVQQDLEINREMLLPGVKKLLNDTILLMLDAREREGRQLGLIVEQRCVRMQNHINTARLRMPDVLQNLRVKLSNKIAEISAEPDFDRLEQELVFVAQKLDVDEELDRLETHIKEVLRLIKQDEPVGRKLDFLMQEMNREANTLGSKSADKEMTAIAIELKVLIEQMREQIQNIE